jgi:hypothetical protein
LAGAVLPTAHGGFKLDIGPEFLGLQDVVLFGKSSQALQKGAHQLDGGSIEEGLEGGLGDAVGR